MFELIQTYFAQAPELGWNAFWISQGLIGIAFVFALISFQFKKREHILLSFIGCLFFIGLHFYILDLQTAAWLFWLGMARYIVALFSISKLWVYFFSLLTIGVFIWTFEEPLEWLVLIGNLIFVYAGFQKNDKTLRELNFVAGVVYLCYMVTIGSPAMIILESFFLISNIVGYYRFYLKPKV